MESLDLPAPERGVRLSPDGTMALAARTPDVGTNHEIWIYEFRRGVSRPLTDQKLDSYWGVWTPDESQVVFDATSDNTKTLPLYRVAADGSQAPELILPADGAWIMPYSWAARGTLLAFQKGGPENTDIWMLPMAGDRKPYPVLSAPYSEIHPAVSPDSRWLAYASNESKRFEVKVRPLTGAGAVVQVSSDGGWEPVWSPDGSTLYYRDIKGAKVMAVAVEPGPVLRVGTPRVLFENSRLVSGWAWGRNYDISADGRRFLMIISSAPPAWPSEYHVILNWAQELKRQAPAK
jgi:eukaryotic-like serine/threonine-protein kinase